MGKGKDIKRQYQNNCCIVLSLPLVLFSERFCATYLSTCGCLSPPNHYVANCWATRCFALFVFVLSFEYCLLEFGCCSPRKRLVANMRQDNTRHDKTRRDKTKQKAKGKARCVIVLSPFFIGQKDLKTKRSFGSELIILHL